MRAFSLSERKKLDSSPYVKKFTEKQIIFTQEFKDLILKGSPDGSTREHYFNHLFRLSCFDKKYVDSCLNRWKKQSKFKDVPKRRGRRKNSNKMTIEELEAEVAYLKEVNLQLKKARGLMDWDL
jgi:hypothetical protein